MSMVLRTGSGAIVVLGAVFFLSCSVVIADAWSGPPASPPNSNVSTPLNIGSTLQSKSGGLYVTNLLESNTLAVYGNAILGGASRYLNWGSTAGTSGYGIRDNAGTLEFKNSGGTWQSLQAFVSGLGGTTQWTTNGTSIYYSGGNVGVGVAAPTAKLQIGNNVATGFLDTYPEYQQILYDSGTAAGSYGFGIKNNTLVFNSGAGGYSFDRAGGATAMAIDTGGKVGIGTESPVDKLHIENGSARVTGSGDIGTAFWTANETKTASTQGYIWGFYNMTGAYSNKFGLYAYSKTGACAGGLCINPFSVYDDGHIYMSDKLGIGTTNPGAKLEVAGDIDVTGGSGTGYSTAPIEVRTTLTPRISFHWPGVVASQIGMDSGGTIRTYDNPGTGYAPFSSGRLTISEASGGYSYITMLDNESANGIKYIHANSNVIGFLGGSGSWLSYWDASGNQQNTGNITAAAFLYASDRRLKENISAMKEGLAKILALSPVSFSWKKDIGNALAGTDDTGFIAQEVEEVIPGIVHTDEKGMKKVDYIKVVPILVKAIQEQQEQIESLSKRVEELESR